MQSKLIKKVLLVCLSYEETGHRGDGEIKVFLNPKFLVLANPF